MLSVLLFTLVPAFMPLCAEIVLTVSGVTTPQGSILIGIYTSQENFNQKKVYREYKVTATAGSVTLNLDDLEPGWYMIAVFHDKNSNMVMDRTLGIPAENYGFSNNAKGFMGPPSFEKAHFRYDGNPIKMTIHI